METENFKSILINCLSQQLSELEILTSIYPNKNDIILDDDSILKDMKDFIAEKTQYIPSHLDLTINIHMDKLKLEISINLPSYYPQEKPNINVRCNQLNRQQETALNLNLSAYLEENHSGEQCLYTAISWIQDNVETYATKLISEQTTTVSTKKDKNEGKFARVWVFSHHIYSKKKRDEIVKSAKDYGLTGFCLPGKPGIICVEGSENECKEWWKIIKTMTWKKIMIRKSEIFDLSNKSIEQKFHNFEEIHFQSKNSKHTNMSEFSKYVEKLGLSNIFNEVFGFCNNNT